MRTRATTREIIDKLKLFEQGLKYCKNCKQTKSINDFAEDKRHTDGLQTYCRECCNFLRRTKYARKIKEGFKKWRADNPTSKTKISITIKKCTHCEKTKPISEFGEDKRKLNGYQSQCRACINELRRTKYAEKIEKRRLEYRQEHLEEIHKRDKARMKQWIKDNPGKHRANCHRRQYREELAGPYYTGEQWQTLLDICGNKCLACGSTENIEADHVIPVSKGGSNNISNIQPLCMSCNRSKHNNHNTDYRPHHIKQWAAAQVTTSIY